MGLEDIVDVGTYGKLLGTGTLSVPPRVEIPLAWDVLAGECTF
jgi:hypothetical protein